VQRCPKNPQEKRSTSTGEETNTPKRKKENKGLNENGHEEFNLTRKVPRDCLRERAVMNLKKNKKEIKLN
jgi:hypothetical protein